MPAATEGTPGQTIPPTKPPTSPRPTAVGPDLSDVDRQRRAHIEHVASKKVSREMTRVLRPWVVWCVTRAPFTTEQTDHNRVGQTYLLLAEDLQLHGDVDPVRAFRHSTVVNHLARRQQDGQTAGTIGAVRANLFPLGRIIAPRNYPPALRRAERRHVRPAATAREVRLLEGAAHRIDSVVGRRLQTILDLTTHAGGRSKELTQVRGRDIVQEQVGNRQVTCVRLTSPTTGRTRMVPVLDPVVACRLTDKAAAVGSGAPLLGTPGNLKNAVNKVLATVRAEHGVQVTVTADQLRGYYITQLAQSSVPAATLMQLTDLGNSHSLFEYCRDLDPISQASLVAILAGVRS